MGPSTVALLAAVSISFAETVVVHHDHKVSPDVEQGDKNFFKKDYPWDKRPVADHHYVFDHPYPAVQDTSDFDKDFVKDENNDGGKWNAQMEYDVLRSKIRQAEKGMNEAKEKLAKEEAEWKAARDRFSKTSAAADSAESARKLAEKEAAAADSKVNKLEGGASKKGTKVGGAVGDAVKHVEKEMSDLENCKKELAAAKQRLKDLIKEKEERDKAHKEEVEAKKKEHKVEKEKKVKDHEKKKGEREVAEKEVAQKVSDESGSKNRLVKEQKEHAEASKSYEQELADVKRTEAQLKEAEKNLRKFRRKPYVDDNGGVYNNPGEKSSARHSSAAGAVLFAIAVAASL